jgi:predicted deacylase
MSMPVAVVNGRRDGPTVFLSGAIHGDELNGVETIRRVLRHLDPRELDGAVIAVPVVNVFGFIEQSRYLPDRRDLNRSFPGSKRGSLASRLANLFMREVVLQSDLGIDFHTAAAHRVNVPQVRADLDDERTRELASAFGTRFIIDSRVRDGSLREAATKRGIRILLYEGGQTQRFEETAVTAGEHGTLRTLEHLGMGNWDMPPPEHPIRLDSTTWVRARRGVIASVDVHLGDSVEKGARIGSIGDAIGGRPTAVTATATGYVIARTLNPLVSQGDALVHIGIES